MVPYNLLDQAEEDTLHKSRLLNVEEKPFKRITKRLLTPNTPISGPPILPPTPPPDASAADEAAAAYESEKAAQSSSRLQWRQDVLLDFAAFESSILRIQFLLTSNLKERERYAAEKLKIQATAQAVRDNTMELRVQLEEAQKTLALRKTYDELAEKITSNRLLRPREDQHANLDKLNAEIAELERESHEYTHTWAERRLQFGKIIEEGMQLRRLIRDEKEEVERREGMEEREDADEGESASQRGRSSGPATPRHDTRGATPMHTNLDSETLQVESHSPLGEKSPLPLSQMAGKTPPEEGEDATMAEDGEVSVGNDAPIAAPAEGLVADDKDEDEREEGEEDESVIEGNGKEDRMDVT